MPKAQPDKPFRFQDMQIYASTEWMVNNRKKYRQVFDLHKTSYVYAELSLVNKLFDQEDWELQIDLRCYEVTDAERRQICDLSFNKKISRFEHLVYIREGWGSKQAGMYWKRGTYLWEAWLDGTLVDSKYFYIEDSELNMDADTDARSFLELESVRLYEGPYEDVPRHQRSYYQTFKADETRYIYADLVFRNVHPADTWQSEVFIKFFTEARDLKGQIVRLNRVSKEDNQIHITAGWGSNTPKSWRKGRYYMEVSFMEELLAVLTFDVEEDGLPDAFFARVADSTGSRTDLVIVNAIGEERIVDAYSGDFGEASMSTLGSSALAFIDLGGQSEGPYVAYRQRDMRAVDRLPTAQPEVLQTADGEVLLYQSATRVSVYDTAGVRTGSADTELLHNGGNYVFAGPVVRRGNAGRDLPSLMYQYIPDSLAVSPTTVLFTDTEGEPVFDAELPVNRATTVQSLVSARVHDGLTYLLYEDYTETSFNDRVADVYVYAVRSASAATDVRSTPAVFYPNPSAVGVTVTIEADLGGGSVDLAILDALGRNVRTSVLPEGERTFEAPLQRGSYFVQLTNRATGAFARQHHIVQP